MDVKKKFIGSLSKVLDWKSNFMVVRKIVPINVTKFDSFVSWGFTTLKGEAIMEINTS